MIYHPDNIWDRGKNRGYSLAEIYHYLPSYIAHLIEYNEDFEIDVNEFLSLPKPVKYFSDSNSNLNQKKYPLKNEKTHSGLVDEVKKIKQEELKEFDYKFPKECLDILDLKKRNEYTAPTKYESRQSKDVSSVWEKRRKQ